MLLITAPVVGRWRNHGNEFCASIETTNHDQKVISPSSFTNKKTATRFYSSDSFGGLAERLFIFSLPFD
jgi:hypothetical protein